MDAKLDWEVDVEGAVGVVDMMDRGESISRRACLRLIQRTACAAFPLTCCSYRMFS